MTWFAIGETFERVVALSASADELRDDRWVEDRSSVADAVYAGGELVQVGDPLFEQVAHTVGPGGEQFERVAGVDVLGEDENPGRGPAFADYFGRAQSLVRGR
jgi:hypothetical protein